MKLDKDLFPVNMNIVGRIDQRQAGHHRRRVAVEDDHAKKSEACSMAEEQGEQDAAAPEDHLQHPHGQV
jgi:hypothetical protein